MTHKKGDYMDLAYRERLKKMRGTKTVTKFAEELGMTKSVLLQSFK